MTVAEISPSVPRRSAGLFTRLLEGLLVAGWAFAYFTARGLMERGIYQGLLGILAVLSLAVLLCLLFHRVRYAHLDDILRRLTRATALGVLIYTVVEPPDLTLVNPEARGLHILVVWSWAPAVAAALVAFWRPVWLALPALHIIITRSVTGDVSGFHISILDIHYMVDMAMLLAASACLLWLLVRVQAGGKRVVRGVVRGLSPLRLSQGFAFIAIGVHLGNYFWSGVAKLDIGPDWSYWMLENATQNAMLPALAIGILPFSGEPGLVQAAHDSVASLQPVANIAIVALQLLAIVAVLRLTLLRLATIGYDILHVSVFLLLGAFFWPWIWNNLSILYALRGRREGDLGWMPRLICIGVILSGMSYHHARSAYLAWFDVPYMKHSLVQARAGADAPWVDVPTAFFLGHSYSVGHGVFGFGQEQGHYPPGARGSGTDLALHLTGEDCPALPVLDNVETSDAREQRLARTRAFLMAHHAKMVDRAAWLPEGWYYWRVHHFPNNPTEFRAFATMPVANITDYRVLTRSICMGLEDGRLNIRSMAETSVVVPVVALE